jgi:threonine dehydrogenase-like Zn-dependent dehydrogenase
MAEEIVMPAGNLYPARGLSLRDAAMVEFLAIGAHAVQRTQLKPGSRTLVVGSGPIGLGVPGKRSWYF